MHVVVTGASGGLGEAVAIELGRRGHSVGLLARRADQLELVAERVRATGARAAWAAADVTDRGGVKAAIDGLVAAQGPVDLLIANAGAGDLTPATRIDAQRITALMRLNFDGVVYAWEAVLPSMLERRAGHVAAVSSIAAFRGMPNHGAYSASKAAVTVLSEAFAGDLAPYGIAVTCIHPGFVRTPMTAKNKFKMPFMLEADDAARRVVNGLERRKRRIDFPFPLVFFGKLARLLPSAVVEGVIGRFSKPPPPKLAG